MNAANTQETFVEIDANAEVTERKINWRRVGLYTALGAVVVGGAVATYLCLRSSPAAAAATVEGTESHTDATEGGDASTTDAVE